MSEPLLVVDGLGMTYGAGGPNAFTAIDHVSLAVEPGEFVCIVGPSGAGKTTMLRCLSGLMAPTQGEVRLLGKRVTKPPRAMALVFQDYSRSLLPWLNLLDNVAMPLKAQGVKKAERVRMATEALASVGLGDHVRKFPWQLSGGMQQRTAIARALAYQPEILLMDEPFASVDAQTRAELEDLLLHVWTTYRITVLLVTHDIDEAVYLADRVVVLSAAPTTVRETLDIPLARPRDHITTKEEPAFAHLRAHVFAEIKATKSIQEPPVPENHDFHRPDSARTLNLACGNPDVPATCPVNHGFDPLSAAHLADPFAVLATLDREGAPVFYAPSLDYYVVTRFADVEEVFRDNATYSAANAQLPLVTVVPEAQEILLAGGHKPQPSMVSLDEPAHARLRGPAAKAFTPKRVNGMEPTIRATTTELLDRVDGLDRFDLVETLTFPLPATTIFSLMGVPAGDVPQLKQWGGVRAGLGWGRPGPDEQVELATGMAEYRGYLRGLVARKQTDRGDDLTSDLLAIHDEAPDDLTTEEIASILFSLSFAGHETTNNLIGNTVRRLLEEPARWDELVADRSLIPSAVEETLRYDTSVPCWRRVTTRPTTLGGVDLPEGAKLLLWIAAAGRDPERFDDPDAFDLHRANARHHIAFGKGIHFCLGANLARLEAAIALGELADRFPRLGLEAGQTLTFHPNISFRGPQHLWVTPERVGT
jgi:cytochrome P450/ABC-type nitrate/sulfonate/bicarbonate transport system ATPase subunit